MIRSKSVFTLALIVLCLTLWLPALSGEVVPTAGSSGARDLLAREAAQAVEGTAVGGDGTCAASGLAARDGQTPAARSAPAWTYLASAVTMSSPRLADVDGDGVREIILATMGEVGNPYSSGRVYIFRRDGTLLPGWPVIVSAPFTSGCPAVADLDGDGDREIVAQSWYTTYVWNADGTNFPGWPKPSGSGSSNSAALADLDGNGDLEIICPTGSTLNVWNHDGTVFPGWPFTAPKNVSPPAVADIDGDGQPEIAAGCNEGPYPGTGPFPFYVFEADGSPATGFPLPDAGGQTRGAISLGDLDGDGSVEIVARINDCIKVWDAHGVLQAGWPVCPDAIRNSATAIGDLDGDGDFEVVIAGFQAQAFHHDGTTVAGWPVAVPPGTANINSGLIIADMDGDPAQREVVVHSRDTFTAIHADGSIVSGFPYPLSDDGQSGTYSAAAAVGDLDGNGQVEYVFVSASGRIAYFDEPLAYSGDAGSWPMMQHDAHNTGFLPRIDPAGLAPIAPSVGTLRLAMANPFAPGGAVSLQTPRAGEVRIDLFAPDGRHVCRVFSGWVDAGEREITWDGLSRDGTWVRPGIYLLSARLGGLAASRTVVLAR